MKDENFITINIKNIWTSRERRNRVYIQWTSGCTCFCIYIEREISLCKERKRAKNNILCTTSTNKYRLIMYKKQKMAAMMCIWICCVCTCIIKKEGNNEKKENSKKRWHEPNNEELHSCASFWPITFDWITPFNNNENFSPSTLQLPPHPLLYVFFYLQGIGRLVVFNKFMISFPIYRHDLYTKSNGISLASKQW